MEGLSNIVYKNKKIIYVDYSNIGDSKEKVTALIKGSTVEYKKNPPKSVLALVNVQNTKFDMDILNIMKSTKEETVPFEKKVAIIGLNGLQKVAYNFIVSLTQKESVRAFNTDLEAKEWLVSD
jgi:hypothetical protein